MIRFILVAGGSILNDRGEKFEIANTYLLGLDWYPGISSDDEDGKKLKAICRNNLLFCYEIIP